MEIFTLHGSNLPTFFFMFGFLYLFAYTLVFRNWGPKHRAEASSCLISLAHGTPVVFMAIHAISTKTNPSIASANTDLQNTVLEYSIAYFITDLLHYLVFLPHDILFILHHVATVYVFFTCRYMVHYGAYEILVVLIFAESTSACQNVWSLAGFRKADVGFADELYRALCLPFYVLYSVVRGVVGPLFVYQMWSVYCGQGDEFVVPKWAWVSWMVVIVIGILLSVVWILCNWIDLYRETSSKPIKSEKKLY